MGAKLCIDAHVLGKHTLAGFRSLFTFTGALFMSLNNAFEYNERRSTLGEVFTSVDSFQEQLVRLPTENQ